jgi:membrane dipeptidase
VQEHLRPPLDHIVGLVGFDHVGLGSDFDGISDVPQGLENASCMPNLTRRLSERGYSNENILKILGGNHLRVLRAVWRA